MRVLLFRASGMVGGGVLRECLLAPDVEQVAVSVFRGDQVYCNYAYQVIQDDLGPAHVDFFDSESPGCWIHAMPPALPGFGQFRL
jgi:hypothetical protein